MGYRWNPFTGNFDRVDDGSASSDIETLTGDSGGAVGPDGAYNIDILGNPDINIVGNPGSNSFQLTNLTKITPYVVGSAGEYAYSTIQSAIDAANADGGGMIYISPGTYNEDLTFYDGIQLTTLEYVNSGTTIINGVHTPPTTGAISIVGLNLYSSTDIFNSNLAGSSDISLNRVAFGVDDGYVFNLPNWTGAFNINDAGSQNSTEDGVINNSAGASIFTNNCQIGAGTTRTFTANGDVRLDLTFLDAPSNISGGTVLGLLTVLGKNMEISGTAGGTIFLGDFFFGGSNTFTMNSSGNMALFNTTFNSSASPVIDGTGAGTLTLGNIAWLVNSGIAGTVNTDFGVQEGGIGYFENLSFDRGTSTLDTNGQVWIGSTTGNPAPSTITGGTGINVVNGANSITIKTHGSVSDSFDTDSGTATPSGGVLTVAGGTNVNTSGASSTVTVNLDGNVLGLTDLTVDNLELNGNTLSSTDTNGNVIIDPDGTGNLQVASGNVDIQGGAAIVDPGAATDSYLQFNESTTGKWRLGNDTTDDSYRISQGSALGTNDFQIITSVGEITFPLTPAFLAIRSSNVTNVTGDGTDYTIIFDSEVLDQNGDYNNSTGIFTAPVTGFYHFGVSIYCQNFGASHSDIVLKYKTSGSLTDVRLVSQDPQNILTLSNLTVAGSTMLYLTAGTTVEAIVNVSGSTKTIGILGNGTQYYSFAWGKLAC